MINIVNEYNKTMQSEAVSILLKDKRIKSLGDGKFGLRLNESDKSIDFIQEDGLMKVQNDITIQFSKSNLVQFSKDDVLNPFDFFVLGVHRGRILDAVHDLNNRMLKKKPPYIRVGTTYFKKTSEKDRDGINREVIIKWKKETLLDDYDKGILELIPKYNSFGIYPDNKNWKESIRGCYNQYAKFSHKALKKHDIDKLKWSFTLVKHVWGDQWELGMKYLQCLYLYPKQILPILALVSSERETGKSTFGDWINILFGDNACVINPSNIGSNHNSSYGTKNIIMIEETKFEKSGDLEKIKALGTQKKITMNPKFVPEYSLPFYGKLIMFSNHEDKFVKIDEEENRYWVLKIPTLEGKANHNILQDLADEVPNFLAYLESLPKPDFSKSRMVFTQDEINTQILALTKINSRSGAHKDILIYLEKEMRENQDKPFIWFRHEGLHAKYFSRSSNYAVSYIKEVLRNEMHLKMDEKTYEALVGENMSSGQTRAYKIENKYYNESDGDDDAPF